MLLNARCYSLAETPDKQIRQHTSIETGGTIETQARGGISASAHRQGANPDPSISSGSHTPSRFTSGNTFWALAPTRLDARCAQRRAKKMLLLHQKGSVKVGEVIRYTLTYTPSADRILPPPSELHVKIRNCSAIPLRAAYLHGPYTLYTAVYPAIFDPNVKLESPEENGIPQFESNLKAGGTWNAVLPVPKRIRESIDGEESITWIIEVTSQVVFSTSATVSYELLVGRDQNSLDLGSTLLGAGEESKAGQLHDHQQSRRHAESHHHHHNAQPAGVFSKAVELVVDDTASLWNKPALPVWPQDGGLREGKPGLLRSDTRASRSSRTSRTSHKSEHAAEHPSEGSRPGSRQGPKKPRKQKKVHLVVLTHGLHSNLGADMLYLKESIDAAARERREAVLRRRAERRAAQRQKQPATDFNDTEDAAYSHDTYLKPGPRPSSRDTDIDEEDDDDDEEEVIVRGFPGNAGRTERGIQHLGKRLAKYVLAMTYPDQPFLPIKKSVRRTLSNSLTGQAPHDMHSGAPVHAGSSIYKGPRKKGEELAYKITSISFIAHSLGGLVQTYAIAYIQKHSPHFFELIQPINFVALAAPFLGLSNENPLYVKFALDFGLVGRTGQDLGLTWRAPNLARSGWDALVGGLGGANQKRHEQQDPGAKPLLRILPTGPAHQALKLFRNRTVYSNVVNDGIVPLRTSCLLFLDWRGLGRVEKARRETGLVGTALGWGWAEITGANSTAQVSRSGKFGSGEQAPDMESVGSSTPVRGEGTTVPLPPENATEEDRTFQTGISRLPTAQAGGISGPYQDEASRAGKSPQPTSTQQQPSNPLSGLLSFFNPKSQKGSKSLKIIKRSQTMPSDNGESSPDRPAIHSRDESFDASTEVRPRVTRGDSVADDAGSFIAPPKTTVFESAGDILNPPIPELEYLIDPTERPRTIFHDRVYHPDDIPPPPIKRRTGIGRSFSRDKTNNAELSLSPERRDSNQSSSTSGSIEIGSMKVEEKIARAYHKDLSWRKVLVRLEPDAHNNMIVRRMFSNAYGWPVVKHLVDTHFADTYAAQTRDEDEPSRERAKPMVEGVGKHGEEVKSNSNLLQSNQPQSQPQSNHARSASEMREARDQITDLRSSMTGSFASTHNSVSGSGSGSIPGTGTNRSSQQQQQSPYHTLIRDESGIWTDAAFDGSPDSEMSSMHDHYFASSPESSSIDHHNYFSPPPRRVLLHRSSQSHYTNHSEPLESFPEADNDDPLAIVPASAKPEIADHLTASPVQSRHTLAPEDNDHESSSSPLLHSPKLGMGAGAGAASAVEVGLRKPVEECLEQDAPVKAAAGGATGGATGGAGDAAGLDNNGPGSKSPGSKASSHVAERVARLSFSKDPTEPSG
ncbi:DUF676-domain-containing protein [Xylona heveae TC161]|uniref:DUF676-domain-containing protein n=1 Tax=Xylona heveae (strain CBS 132557 / TC161) TaxID=1328760 RepID=A0A165FMX2_XYLHT|nr:DUF676-domain-containing protein [Xylona heveae TC161]KZF21171.1 DUF676-domain-containing protein [Xylona heveae TC161]